jgi:hypothetical protein
MSNFLLATCVNLVCSYDPYCCEISWDVVCQEIANNICTCSCCDADLSGDGKVSGTDIGILIGEWGSIGDNKPEDLNGDGVVNGADLGILLQSWGSC